jgi:hypothetical protein
VYQIQQEGYRYLDLLPQQVLSLTHKEFYMMMEQRVEKNYDELERESIKAMMMRAAYHSDKKNMKATDLFNRDQISKGKELDDEDMKEKMRKQQEFLNRLDFSRKEEANG